MRVAQCAKALLPYLAKNKVCCRIEKWGMPKRLLGKEKESLRSIATPTSSLEDTTKRKAPKENGGAQQIGMIIVKNDEYDPKTTLKVPSLC